MKINILCSYPAHVERLIKRVIVGILITSRWCTLVFAIFLLGSYRVRILNAVRWSDLPWLLNTADGTFKATFTYYYFFIDLLKIKRVWTNSVYLLHTYRNVELISYTISWVISVRLSYTRVINTVEKTETDKSIAVP